MIHMRVNLLSFYEVLLIGLEPTPFQSLSFCWPRPSLHVACSVKQVKRALSEAAAARRELDAQKAINRALDEQQRTLDDQRMKDEVTIRDLTNELADKSEQVATTQRKLVLARTNRYSSSAQRVILLSCSVLLHPSGIRQVH